MTVDPQHYRMVEALLFAAAEPLDEASLATRLPDGIDLPAVLADIEASYAGRGVNLVKVAGKWALRTAPDLKYLLEKEVQVSRRLSRAAVETLAIVAYHQPITRAEIEEVRGVGLNKGTLDLLLEIGWIRPRGRRRTPGRPVTYGTTDTFLEHFDLSSVEDLPGIEELKAAGLLQPVPPVSLVDAARREAEVDEESGGDDEPSGESWEDDEDDRESALDPTDDDRVMPFPGTERQP
jgi:segregation and condensation protein B